MLLLLTSLGFNTFEEAEQKFPFLVDTYLEGRLRDEDLEVLEETAIREVLVRETSRRIQGTMCQRDQIVHTAYLKTACNFTPVDTKAVNTFKCQTLFSHLTGTQSMSGFRWRFFSIRANEYWGLMALLNLKTRVCLHACKFTFSLLVRVSFIAHA